jgi:hypothetical protein
MFLVLLAVVVCGCLLIAVLTAPPGSAWRTRDPDHVRERDVLAEQRSSRARYVALEHEAMAHWETLCNCPDVTRAFEEIQRNRFGWVPDRDEARRRTCEYVWASGSDDRMPVYCSEFAKWPAGSYEYGRARDTRPHA